jgi:hypothetical protein
MLEYTQTQIIYISNSKLCSESVQYYFWPRHQQFQTESSSFWVMTRCSPMEVNRRFGEKCHLNLQDWKIIQGRNQRESIVARKLRLDHGMPLITQPVHVLSFSISAMEGNNGTARILCDDIAAQSITEPPPCFTVGTEPGILNCRRPSLYKRKHLSM